jgi:hypothetical protein
MPNQNWFIEPVGSQRAAARLLERARLSLHDAFEGNETHDPQPPAEPSWLELNEALCVAYDLMRQLRRLLALAVTESLGGHSLGTEDLLEAIQLLRTSAAQERLQHSDLEERITELDAKQQRLRERASRHEPWPRGMVLWFAVEMERQLRANDHKGGWQNCSRHFLRDKLQEEYDELCAALEQLGGGNPSPAQRRDVCNEAADLANLAMMVADLYGTSNAQNSTPPTADPDP